MALEYVSGDTVESKTNIRELKEKVRVFCEERDWDQYHGAKDLSIGIITEASELLEHFCFKSEAQVEAMMKDPKKREEISEEMADVFCFLLRLAQRYDINLAEALDRKMEKNRTRYPVVKAKGSNRKYSEL